MGSRIAFAVIGLLAVIGVVGYLVVDRHEEATLDSVTAPTVPVKAATAPQQLAPAGAEESLPSKAEPGRPAVTAGTIAGTVLTPEKSSLERIRAICIPADEMPEELPFSFVCLMLQFGEGEDFAGREFRFTELELNERYYVFATAAGWAGAWVQSPTLSAEQPEASVEVELSAPGTVEGTAVYEGGLAARDVYVHLVWDGESHGLVPTDESISEVKTDEFGTFSLEGLVVGPYALLASRGPMPQFESDRGKTRFSIDRPGDSKKLTVVVQGKAGSERLEGWVVDDAGTPVDGASVEVWRDSETVAESRTDEKGWFHVTDIEDGTYTLFPSKDATMKADSQEVATSSGPVTLVLPRTGSISGHVVASDGTVPEEFVVVACRPNEHWYGRNLLAGQKVRSRDEWRSHSEENGKFSIEGIERRQVKLVVFAKGFAPLESPSIECIPGETVEGIELVVTDGARIEGRVVAAGVGLEGAEVGVYRLQADREQAFSERYTLGTILGPTGQKVTSGEEGDFSFDGLAPGNYALVARHPDWGTSGTARVSLEADQALPLTIVLQERGAIAGRVFDSIANEPCQNVLVSVNGPDRFEMLETGSDGTFRAEDLTPGDHIVLIDCDDHDHLSQLIEVFPGEIASCCSRCHGTLAATPRNP